MARERDMLAERASPVGQLALLVDSLVDYAIFLLDPDGHVVTWNAGAARTKGYTAPEIVGEHYEVFFAPEDRELGAPAEALEIARRDGRYEAEAWRVRKDGGRLWAHVVVTALRDDEGNLVGYGKVTRDLTELRAAQQDLELFASSAAHDLQEPLRTIQGFTQLLTARHADGLPEEGREFLEHVDDAAQRMQRLISDLLTYARTAARELAVEPVAVAAALETALSALGFTLAERGIAVGAEVPADAAVRADARGVAQVLQNLLSNAVKFADPDSPEVAVSASRDGGEWWVSVGDNGPGVAEADRERIFEPFVQLHRAPAGTGLGLAISRRIVERHGGRIGVDAAPERGSRFWFALPAA